MPIREQIEALFETWGRFIVRQRWAAIVIMSAVTVGLVSWLPNLEVDNSSEAFLHPDDPERIRYDEFRARFNRDDRVILILHPPEIFDLSFLEKLRRFHHELEEEVPYVEEIISLLNMRNTYGREDELVVEDLMEEWPETEADLALLKERVLSNPLYKNILISENGKYTTLSIKPFTYSTLGSEDVELEAFEAEEESAISDEPAFLSDNEGHKLVDAVRSVIARYKGPDFSVHLTGPLASNYTLTSAMARDVSVFQTLSILVTAFLLYLLFRRFSGVVLPLVVVNASLLASMGIMAGLEIPMSVTIQILPAFLTVVGVCDAIHILTIVYQQMADGASKQEAIAFALGHSGLAVVMTSLTTAAGLLSFVFAAIAPVSNLGIIAPIGIMLAMVYSLVLLPALLAVIRLKPVAVGNVRSRRGWTEHFLTWSAKISTTHPWGVLGVTAVILVIFGGGVLRVHFSQNPMLWYPETEPVRIASDVIDREFKGASTAEVIIDTGRENGLHEPGTLKGIERAMNRARTLKVGDKPINKAVSIVDLVKETHQALNENRHEFYALPQERLLIAQELLLFENSGSDDLEDFTDSQFRTARVTIRTPWVDAMLYPDFLAELRSAFTEILGNEIDFEVTGRTPLFARVFKGLLLSFARSYTFALVVITPMLVLLIGSLRRGFTAMIPNLIPVFMVLGLMGWTDIPLDMSSMLIGGIVIGLAADDTIHFMHKFNRYYDDTGSAPEAVRQTLATTGTALLFTSLVLTLGFAVFMFAYMRNGVWFGLLTSFATIVAFLSDVVLGPALMVLVTRWIERRRSR